MWENLFLFMRIFFINSVSFCYCRGSYEPPHYCKRKFYRSSVSVVFCKIGVLAKFLEKHLWRTNFSNKLAGWKFHWKETSFITSGFIKMSWFSLLCLLWLPVIGIEFLNINGLYRFSLCIFLIAGTLSLRIDNNEILLAI